MKTGIITLNIRGSVGFLIMCFWITHLVISGPIVGESQQNTDWGEVMVWYHRKIHYLMREFQVKFHKKN